jgi:hypothetical protein
MADCRFTIVDYRVDDRHLQSADCRIETTYARTGSTRFLGGLRSWGLQLQPVIQGGIAIISRARMYACLSLVQ